MEAIVVSDIRERLSPNIAALTTIPAMRGAGIVSFCASAYAMGRKAAMAPIEVPTEREKKLTIIKIPGRRAACGRKYRPSDTAASILPIAVAA